MTDKKISIQFTVITFCIAYLVSGILIAWGHFGYRVYSWVRSFQQFAMEIPFAIYILSPAIASYIVLKRSGKIAGIKEWLKTVFHIKNTIYSYLFVAAGLVLYFGVHIALSDRVEMVLPFYTVFLSLPGNIIIGGLEEAGWMYVLQPRLDKKYGFVSASIVVGVIWVFWHIPLFFIPGTNHCEGLINFWMFNVQVMSFSLFRGAIYKISGKGFVFVCLLFHAIFNAVSPIFGTMTMTWAGTIAANAAIMLFSFTAVIIHNKKKTFQNK